MPRTTLLLIALLIAFATPTAPAAPPPKSADVIVYGGTPGGIATAIAAARHGSSVILLEQTKHVGGLNTSGLNTAETEHMLKPTFGGIALEFYTGLGKEYGKDTPVFYWESKIAEKVFNRLLSEAKVNIEFDKLIKSIQKTNRRIDSIEMLDGSTYTAKVFVDCTYEGDLMALAGVSFAVGRESKEQYNETNAGIRLIDKPIPASPYGDDGKLLPFISALATDLKEGAADPRVMNYNVRLTVTADDNNKAPLPEPKHYDRSRYLLLERYLKANPTAKLASMIDFYKRANGKYELNNRQAAVISLGHFGAQFDWPTASHARRKEIFDDHFEYTLGLFHFLATDDSVPQALREETRKWGLPKDEYPDNNHLPYYIYVREARRMVGQYIVTEHDILENRTKEDSIALGSHWIDSHHVQRVAIDKDSFANEGRIWVQIKQPYQYPYRALTPKPEQCENLLVPVCASTSHVGFCSTRLESMWMFLGHAAGAAASMAAKDGAAVQAIDVTKLRDQLRADKQVIDLPTTK